MIIHLGTQELICYFRLDELFTITTFWHNDQDAVRLLARWNFNILQFFELVSLSLNLMLCLDIVFTMRNPFYPHDRRMKFYLPISVLFAFMAYNLCLSRVPEPDKEWGPNNFGRAMFSVGFISLYLVMAISSVAYAYRVNTRPGMSTEVRKDFIWRQIMYVSCYILTWLPYLGFSYFILYTTTVEGHDVTYKYLVETDDYTDTINVWSLSYNFSCIGTGILMSIVRI